MEPAFVLLPNRPRATGSSAGTVHSQPNQQLQQSLGPCTCLVSLHPSPFPVQSTGNSNENVYIGSGHLNGWCAFWSLGKRRSTRQWIAHTQAQVSALFYWPREQPELHTLISHGRDGFIRFWLINSNGYPNQVFSSPEQCFTELRTCEFTFCQASFWPDTDDVRSTGLYYLAHVCAPEDSSAGAVQGTDVEVVQLPQNVIVANTSMDSARGPNISGISELGMCMALQGIPNPGSDPGTRDQGCLLLAAFESGHLLLLSRGQLLARLHSVLGNAVPIMSLAVSPRFQAGQLIAVGGPSLESSSHATADSARPMAFVHLVWDPKPELRLHPDKLETRSCGVSTLSWRDDGRLLAVGQWDGELRMVEAHCSSRQKWRLRCLGWLTSLGVTDSGDLLGDWAATTVKQPHGPTVDQRSTTIRACLFTPESHWLISAAPASAGAVGTLLVWDVYRTMSNPKL